MLVSTTKDVQAVIGPCTSSSSILAGIPEMPGQHHKTQQNLCREGALAAAGR
jgi:hypothetical protein